MASTVLRRRTGLGVVTVRDFASTASSNAYDPTIRDGLPLLIPKRSEAHSLIRVGYDENSKASSLQNTSMRYDK